MKNKNNSILKSRLRISKSAFIQSIDLGLAQAIGIEVSIQGFDVRITKLTHEACDLDPKTITQVFHVSMDIKKAKGWMPLESSLDVRVELHWSILPRLGLPGMKILDIKVAMLEKAQVNLFNMNIGVPKMVERKLFAEIVDKKEVIEDFANKKMRELILPELKKMRKQTIPSMGHEASYALRRLQWATDQNEDEITFVMQSTLWTELNVVERLPFEFQINPKSEEEMLGDSILRLTVPYDEIRRLLIGRTIPIGRLGESTIRDISFSLNEKENLLAQCVFTGDKNFNLEMELNAIAGERPKLNIEKLALNFENKLLDFGASLFDEKIKEKIQVELDNLITRSQDKIKVQLHSIANRYSTFLTLTKVEEELVKAQAKVVFLEEECVLIVKTDALSEAKLHALPTDFKQLVQSS